MKSILILLTVFALTGCTSGTIRRLNRNLKEFDKLGLEEVYIPGRYTKTTYKAEGDKRTITHSNPLLAPGESLRIVRKVPTSK